MTSVSAEHLSGKDRPPVLVSSDKRGIRHELRPKLQQITTSETFNACGRPISGVNGVTIVNGPKGSGFGGLRSCGKGWICPCCAGKVGAHRADEISQVVAHQLGTGSVAMVTMTMRHTAGQRLHDLWTGLSAAWKAATNGRGWRTEREMYGCDGYVRAVEITHGKNGWHVHVHALLMFSGDVSENILESFSDAMFDRWTSKLVSLGFAAPLRNSGGLDVRKIGGEADQVLAAYLTKIASGVGMEVGSGDGKSGRHGNRAPWEIAVDAVGGDPQALELWREFEFGSMGRRAIAWSRGLRARAGLGAELTDAQIVEQEESAPVMVAIIPARSWMMIRNCAPYVFGEILGLVEAGATWENLRDHLHYRLPAADVRPPIISVRK